MSGPQYFERSGSDPLPPSVGGSIVAVAEEDGSPEGMTMVGHLTELRDRVLISVGAVLLGLGLGLWQALPLIELLERMAPKGVQFVQLGPGEVFMTAMRVAFYLAVALALPVILYQLLRFVMPGLSGREKPMLMWSVMGGAVLFALGMVFSYFCVIPLTLSFFMEFGQSVAASQISVERYVGFCAAMLLMGGLMFELPMILFLLSFTGLVSSAKLLAEWRWALVIIVTASAVITPSQDPFTLMVVSLAMSTLYALSILPIRMIGR